MILPVGIGTVLGADVKTKINTCASLEGGSDSALPCLCNIQFILSVH